MLLLVAVGQGQPAALGSQEVSLERIVDGALGLLACLPRAFVAVDDLCGEVLEHARLSSVQAGARSVSQPPDACGIASAGDDKDYPAVT
jgi:hypothetical protein